MPFADGRIHCAALRRPNWRPGCGRSARGRHANTPLRLRRLLNSLRLLPLGLRRLAELPLLLHLVLPLHLLLALIFESALLLAGLLLGKLNVGNFTACDLIVEAAFDPGIVPIHELRRSRLIGEFEDYDEHMNPIMRYAMKQVEDAVLDLLIARRAMRSCPRPLGG